MELDLDDLSTATLFDDPPSRATATASVRERGTVVGRYVLLRELGVGGMGEVWAAWDPQLDREVAIKFLRRMRSPSDQQRLLREAQAMARIAHPNIVVVHDVGDDQGGLFVAMQLIVGHTLRAWRTAAERQWHQIVAVYVEAARGLAAAHDAGLVHRDFKPDNAMIEDETGRVRVMDFGLAAAVEGNLRETVEDAHELDIDPSLVRHGSSDAFAPMTHASVLVGTPAYMSPEQLGGRRGGPASDQFSLCVSLWEALYGDRPYAGETLEETERAMLAGQRRVPSGPRVPDRIQRALERGLAPDPQQRWPSMSALIAELEAPARRSDRVRIAALALAVAGLVSGASWVGSRTIEACDDQQPRLAGVWDGPRRVELERAVLASGAYGQEAAPRVIAELDRFAARWLVVSAAACRGHDGVPEALAVAQALCLERSHDALSHAVSLLAEADADIELVSHAIELVRELPAPERCAEVSALVALDEDRGRVDDPALADGFWRELDAADVLARAGRWDAVIDTLAPLRDSALLQSHAKFRAQLLAGLGWAYYERRESDEAIDALSQAYELALATGADVLAAEVALDLVYANTRGQPRLDVARAWDHSAGALLGRTQAGPELRGTRLAALGYVAETAGEPQLALTHYQQAEQLYAQAGASIRRARLIDDIGAVLVSLGEIERGRALQLESMQVLAEQLGPSHPDVVSVHYKLGTTAFAANELDEAARQFQRVIEIGTPMLGSDAALVAAARTGLGATLLVAGDHTAARAVFEQVIQSGERRFGAAHPELVPALVNLCVAEIALEQLDAAEQHCRRALDILEATHGGEHPSLLAALDNLGDIRMQQGDPTSARAYYRRSLALGEQAYGATNVELDYALIGLGETSLALGEAEQALAWFERVVAGREHEGKHLGLLARGEFGLAQLADARGDRQQALQLGQRALDDMRAAPQIERSMLPEIEAWLAARGG